MEPSPGDSELGSSARFRKLLESAPDAILEVDAAGIIVLVNAQAEQMFRCTREDLLGKSIDALVPARFRPIHQRHREGYVAHPTTRPMGSGLNLWAVRQDGSDFAVDINLSPVCVEEGNHVICIIRDVTERNRVEEKIRSLNQILESRGEELALANEELAVRNREVERANQLKSEFLASMSHELRTPLNAIIGFSDLLAEQSAGPLNPKQLRYLNHIQQGASHLLALINDVLDLSKIEADRMELRPESFAVRAAVAEVASAIRPLAEARSIQLELSCADATTLYADRMRVKQILYNLLSNAIKFTPAGGRVDVTCESTRDSVSISVIDTGVGIPEEHLPSVFDSFRQFGPTTKGVREGTGLGLAITRKLVEMHCGRISVVSQVGKGSTFTVKLPVQPFQEPDSPVAPSEKRLKPLILVVDDNPSAGELLVNHLETAGFGTVRAMTGIEAVRKARELQPDVITLDILMPHKTGWEALHELKRTPGCSSIPTIIVSVVDQEELGLSLGASECLTKPVSRETLLATIRRVLPESQRTFPGGDSRSSH